MVQDRIEGSILLITWVKGLKPGCIVCSVEDDVALALVDLSSLEHLSLGFNKLEGELSCSLLEPGKQLHELDLAHNEIEGSIPECLLSSNSIQELYLADNQLSSSLPRLSEDVPLTTLSVADQASAMSCHPPLYLKALSPLIPGRQQRDRGEHP